MKLTLKFPALETKTVWIGRYGGYYGDIVFFSEKPKNQWIDCLENKKNIVGSMDANEFMELFPDAGLPKHIQNGRQKSNEIPEVIEIELTAIWKEGKLRTIDFSCELETK